MILSIIVPIYNEEKTVAEILKRIIASRLPKGFRKEIIAVDDGSGDKTVEIIQGLKIKELKLIKHPVNKGKGAAVRTGFSKASGDIFLIQDADLEYDPKDYLRLLSPMVNDKAVVVYGSRLQDYPLVLWGSRKTPLPSHLIGNKLLTFITNLLYGSNLTDMETCYKLFQKDVIRSLDLVSNRFEIEPEITAKLLKQGVKIVEVPIKVQPRTHNEGKKIHWYDGIGAITTLLKYRFIN